MLWVRGAGRAAGCPPSPGCGPQTEEECLWHKDLQPHLNFLTPSAPGASTEGVAVALQTTGGFCSTIWTTDLCKSPRQKSLWRHMTTEKE